MASALLSKLWTKLSNKKTSKTIMLVGLDNGGKTSIINRFIKLINKQKAPFQETFGSGLGGGNNFDDENEFMVCLPTSNLERSYIEFQLTSSEITPTAGYNYERVQYKETTLVLLDFSGQNRYRNLWQEFYNSVDGIIFVVDSSDLIRFVVARDELENMLNHPYFSTLDNYNNNNNPHQISSNDHQQTITSLKSSSSSQPSPAAIVVQNPAIATQKQITISQGKLIQSPLDTNPLILSSGSSGANMTPDQQHKHNNNNINNNNNNSNINSNQKKRLRTKIPILIMANKADLSNSVTPEVIAKALNLSQLPSSRHPWHIQATSVCASQGIFEGFDWLLSQLVS